MTETPSERAERVERLYDKCALRDGGSMADVATLRNDVRAMFAEYNKLRHVVDNQAHRIQGGLDRIAELEAELKDANAIGEQCTATTGRRLTVQCGREAGHDDAHAAEVGGGHISWHADTTPAGA